MTNIPKISSKKIFSKKVSSNNTSALMLFKTGDLRFALPASELVTIELCADIEYGKRSIDCVGRLSFDDFSLMVVEFERDLSLRTQLSDHAKFIACLSNERPDAHQQSKITHNSLAIACDSIDSIDIEFTHLHSLPEIMSNDISPIKQLAIYQERILLYSNTNQLVQYLKALVTSEASHVCYE